MLRSIGEGIWYDMGPVSMLGMQLTATMTVLRLEDGGLLVHSPLPLTEERRAEVTALGEVRHLYAPNTFHHAWLGEWTLGFPEALVHAPRALLEKRPELHVDRFHDEDRSRVLGELVHEVPIRGFRMFETALVHGPSRTAIVTDLVQNIGRPTHRWTRFYSRAMGFYDQISLSRVLRWTAFSDRGAARHSIDALLDHDIAGLIVGHGEPIVGTGHAALVTGTGWLPPATKSVESVALVAPKPPRALWAKPCG